MNTTLYWMGKPVDELSHAEAIEAVKIMGAEIEMMRKTFKQIREIDRRIADRRVQYAKQQHGWWLW
jgi:hypothetical protein